MGDTPLISLASLQKLVLLPDNTLGLLTANAANPNGFGRVLRDPIQKLMGIVEQQDAMSAQRKIKEINTGVMIALIAVLQRWVQCLNNDNAQGEYYLTDIVAMAVKENYPIHTVQPSCEQEVWSVNDQLQLAKLEHCHQRQTVKQLIGARVHHR